MNRSDGLHAVTRVESNGHVIVQLNVLTKDMEVFGYTDGSGKDGSGGIKHL